MAVLAGCANYAGIHSDRQMTEPGGLATTQSLPAEQGRWPVAGWATSLATRSSKR